MKCILIQDFILPVLLLIFSLARKKSSGLESAGTIRTKVFVWGLNDKDQLGGLKGSKVQMKMYLQYTNLCCPSYLYNLNMDGDGCLLKSVTVMFTKDIDFIFSVLYECICATFKQSTQSSHIDQHTFEDW